VRKVMDRVAEYVIRLARSGLDEGTIKKMVYEVVEASDDYEMLELVLGSHLERLEELGARSLAESARELIEEIQKVFEEELEEFEAFTEFEEE